jgi:hypothetical protein
MIAQTSYKQAGLLFAGLVIVLAALALGYAAWTKQLFILGEVNTGNIDAQFTKAEAVISSPNEEDSGLSEEELADKLKDTKCEASIDGEDDQIVHFSIENGFPSLTCQFTFEVEYKGSVPAKVQNLQPITNLPGGAVWSNGVELTVTVKDEGEPVDLENLEDHLKDNVCGTQLHDGDKEEFTIQVHIEQEAEQDETYIFGQKITLVNWNQFDPEGCDLSDHEI